jgi:hypothetical protein
VLRDRENNVRIFLSRDLRKIRGYYNRDLNLIPIILIVLLLSVTCSAIESAFQYIKIENAKLVTKIAITDSLPTDLVTYINKGVPILFQYKIELWRERAGWFDELQERNEVSYKIRYDPWEKEYSVVQVGRDQTIENTLRDQRGAIDLLKSTGSVSFSVSDTGKVFYLTGELTIKTMSFTNFKEVESWLKGEISNARKPDLKEAPDKIGEFVFDMALKISGIKNNSNSISSQRFKLDTLSISSSK